jgi:carboxymethylenebutenolidase
MQSATASPERLRRNLEQAYFYLDLMPSTGAIGTVGWCFGGGWSLRAALMFPDELDASVIYYGELVTDRERLAALNVPILGLFGSADSVVPIERARAFERALSGLEKPHEIRVYDGAAHAFANPSGESYDPDAAARAWGETMAFLRKHLRGDGPAADGGG